MLFPHAAELPSLWRMCFGVIASLVSNLQSELLRSNCGMARVTASLYQPPSGTLNSQTLTTSSASTSPISRTSCLPRFCLATRTRWYVTQRAILLIVGMLAS